MNQNTTPTQNVAHGPLQSARMALYQPARNTYEREEQAAAHDERLSHSDLDIERHTMIDDCMAELLDEYRANSTNATLTIQHALIELRSAQDQLQSMSGDIYDLLLLDRRLTVIRQLLEGVTT